jgi:hypothetical protein
MKTFKLDNMFITASSIVYIHTGEIHDKEEWGIRLANNTHIMVPVISNAEFIKDLTEYFGITT